MQSESKKHGTIAGLGEVLSDVSKRERASRWCTFERHRACHQLPAPLGLVEGVVISRIGADLQGAQILESLRSDRMSTEYVQTIAIILPRLFLPSCGSEDNLCPGMHLPDGRHL